MTKVELDSIKVVSQSLVKATPLYAKTLRKTNPLDIRNMRLVLEKGGLPDESREELLKICDNWGKEEPDKLLLVVMVSGTLARRME